MELNWQSIATTATPMTLLGVIIVWYIRYQLPAQRAEEAERRKVEREAETVRRAEELATYERSLARVVDEAKATRAAFTDTITKLEKRLDDKDEKIIEILQQRAGGQ